MQRIVSLALVIALMMTYMMTPTVYAQDIEVNYFYRTWARTDKVVADRQVDRTWMWGPESRGVAFLEPYVDSPAGTRIVQYFDKSRMEISHPDRTPDPVWYVTNGLLVVELVTGELQTGDRQFVTREPADINVAGDLDHPASPTYRLFGTLMDDH
ncbi:MAG: hypothetical protein M3439_03900, partial [Chloroflexota bacterium]|nr:hypothetical protein [Chloroflexota bacterium]